MYLFELVLSGYMPRNGIVASYGNNQRKILEPLFLFFWLRFTLTALHILSNSAIAGGWYMCLGYQVTVAYRRELVDGEGENSDCRGRGVW